MYFIIFMKKLATKDMAYMMEEIQYTKLIFNLYAKSSQFDCIKQNIKDRIRPAGSMPVLFYVIGNLISFL